MEKRIMKKYEFTEETKIVFGITLRRLRAVVSFGIVRKGELEEFSKKVQMTHGDNRHGRVYRMAIEMAKLQIVIPEEMPDTDAEDVEGKIINPNVCYRAEMEVEGG